MEVRLDLAKLSPQVLRLMAQETEDSLLLGHLAEVDDVQTLIGVAANRNTYTTTLFDLSYSKYWQVLSAVVSNPKAFRETKERLAKHDDARVRQAALEELKKTALDELEDIVAEKVATIKSLRHIKEEENRIRQELINLNAEN